jgi:LPS-assembly protein
MSEKALLEGCKPRSVAIGGSRRACLRCFALAMGLLVTGSWLTAGALPAHAEKGDLLKTQVAKNETNQPLLLQADELVYDKETDRVIAKGNVEVYYKNYALTADSLTYDQKANTLNALGNVRIKEPDGAVINADRITLTDDFRDGFIRSFQAVTKDEARIAAANAYKEGNTTVFERGVFTPCKQCEDNPDAPPIWRIKARKITHKKDEQNVYFEDGVFELFGVPLIWLPYAYYPDPTVKRRSGFLNPEFSQSDDLGLATGISYYYTFSPSVDLTVTPIVTTEAGFLLKTDFRQRLEHGSYRIEAAGAFDDDPDGENRDDSEFRGSIKTVGEFDLGSWWKWGWDATLETDESFRRFYKIDDVLDTDRISQVYLIGQSERNYFQANLYHFGGLTADDNDGPDSKADSIVYPSIDYNYIYGDPVLGGELSFDSNVLALSRDDGSDSVARLINQVKWRRSFYDPMGQIITPFMQARADLYSTSSFDDPNFDEAGDGTTAFRGSAVAGVEYRYPFVKHTESATHVVEPIAQVIARPDIEDQGDIPNEDARSLVFDDTLLFDIDKFSGFDRIETGTRANVGVQYSVSTAQGWNARFVAGQSYQVAGVNSFGDDTGLEEQQSDYVLGAYLDLSRNLQFVSQVRLDENDLEVKRHDLAVTGSYGPFLASVNYVNAQAQPALGFEEDREELAGAAAIKIADHWTVFGDLRFDLDEEDFVRNAIGIKYTDECFMLSVSYIETNIDDGEIQPDQTVLVRYNLLTTGDSNSRTDTIGTFSDLPVIK